MRNLRNTRWWPALCVLALGCSCDTQNVGTGPPSLLSATIAVPGAMNILDDATWTATITGGIPPYVVSWDFGGGMAPDTPRLTGEPGPTTSVTVRPAVELRSFFARVSVTDSTGTTFSTPPPGVSYSIGSAGIPSSLIDSAAWNAADSTITVAVSSPQDGDTLTVTVDPPPGFTVDQTAKTAAATGPLIAVFNVGADDIFAGAAGNFGVSATDGSSAAYLQGGLDVTIPSVTLAPATLYAIPLQRTAHVGEPLRWSWPPGQRRIRSNTWTAWGSLCPKMETTS